MVSFVQRLRLAFPEQHLLVDIDDGYVDHLLANPNAELTPLRGNRLWQLALLEMWLQTHLPDSGNAP
jgi:hypothetical protein